MEPSVTALIAESHVTSMRLIASIAQQHFDGSNQAVRMLKREKKISSATDRLLDCMSTTYFVSEHIDVVMCNDFLRALERYVKGMSASHLETPPKTQAPINVSVEDTNLLQPRELFPQEVVFERFVQQFGAVRVIPQERAPDHARAQ